MIEALEGIRFQFLGRGRARSKQRFPHLPALRFEEHHVSQESSKFDLQPLAESPVQL